MANREQQIAQEVARKRAQAKAQNFSELFRSDLGKQVLAEICDQFDRPVLSTGEAHTTAVFAAQRDVVQWIKECVVRGDSIIMQDIPAASELKQ